MPQSIVVSKPSFSSQRVSNYVLICILKSCKETTIYIQKEILRKKLSNKKYFNVGKLETLNAVTSCYIAFRYVTFLSLVSPEEVFHLTAAFT